MCTWQNTHVQINSKTDKVNGHKMYLNKMAALNVLVEAVWKLLCQSCALLLIL
jgi:hypothetical protein